MGITSLLIYGGFDTIKSNFSSIASNHEPLMNRIRVSTLFFFAFLTAISSAPRETSAPTPLDFWNSDKREIKIHPDPVPKSRISIEASLSNRPSAKSIIVSVSGRGSSVSSDISKGRPQNSRTPWIRDNGLPPIRCSISFLIRFNCSDESWFPLSERISDQVKPHRSSNIYRASISAVSIPASDRSKIIFL